jgi:peptidoglycan/LPS O-acetylase OafA/YrhL
VRAHRSGYRSLGGSVNSRNQSLDVLRGIAILLVLGRHYVHYQFWAQIGWIGVDLFFVLSGFLISGLLFSEAGARGSINYMRFILRRGLKIWPGLYVSLALTLAGTLWAIPGYSLKGFIVSSLFVLNYFPRHGPEAIGPTWSLAVEEHFYLLLPLLLIWLLKLNNKQRDPFASLPWLFCALASACLLLRVLSLDSPTIFANRATHLRIDSLFAGVTLGYLYHHRPAWFQRLSVNYALPLALALTVPIAAFVNEDSVIMKTVGLTSLLLGFSFLVAWAVGRSPRSIAGRSVCAVVARIGFYSYSIYLWHGVASIFFKIIFGISSALGFWLYLASAILIGIAMAKLVEIPVLKLRDQKIPASKEAAQLTRHTSHSGMPLPAASPLR